MLCNRHVSKPLSVQSTQLSCLVNQHAALLLHVGDMFNYVKFKKINHSHLFVSVFLILFCARLEMEQVYLSKILVLNSKILQVFLLYINEVCYITDFSELYVCRKPC